MLCCIPRRCCDEATAWAGRGALAGRSLGQRSFEGPGPERLARERSRPRWECEGLLLRAGDTDLHEGGHVEPALDGGGLLEAHTRARVLGHEERAAVGIRFDRGLERPEGLRLDGDLELVHADQRAEDWQAGG